MRATWPRRVLIPCVVWSCLCGDVGRLCTYAAPQVPRTVESSGLEFVTRETDEAIQRGLAYLASQQNDDGSFGASSIFRYNTAVVAICGMAFLSAGHTPGRGRYGGHLDKALNFILQSARPNGMLHMPNSTTHGPMYGHGFATLFLAEVYGMSPRPDVREKLEGAIKLIINTQNKAGGWRYEPDRREADISVTVCQIMALRAARNSGIFVPKDTVDACIKYVTDCQNPDGGFKYQLIDRSPSVFPRSAAGVVALYSAGVYEGRAVDRGLRYLENFRPQGDVFRHENNYFYGQYYAVQAMWLAGGERWDRWYPAIRDELLRRQMNDGSWPDSISSEYGTAMACIVLQMPNNYVPIFQR